MNTREKPPHCKHWREGCRQGSVSFLLMSMEFRIRDLLRPPIGILREEGVSEGMTVLDYGCGAGGFTIAAGRLVGKNGRIYGADIHPLAIRKAVAAARRHGLGHVEIISGEDLGRIPDKSVDIALLFDVLHELPDPAVDLGVIGRVLKPGGTLSVRDHHLDQAMIEKVVTSCSDFRLVERRGERLRFLKAL
ncbi:MAG: class I SAM-dependent methyltransferase [Bacteroidota bacterium]|nr:class I SAM-dependent methyltransferase [Bacteroidota bacterium]